MARRGTKLGAALVASVCSVALFGAPGAVAGDTKCNTGLNSTLTGTFDNVVVPPGATCQIHNAQVKGNVKALEDSFLLVTTSTFRGNVVGDKAQNVDLRTSTIRGNVEIKEGESAAGTSNAVVQFNTFTGGNVKIEKMTGANVVVRFNQGIGNIQLFENPIPPDRQILVVENVVAGDLQVFKNVGPGPKQVATNTVGGNLQCFDNALPFTTIRVGFGPNDVTGNAEGQCAP